MYLRLYYTAPPRRVARSCGGCGSPARVRTILVRPTRQQSATLRDATARNIGQILSLDNPTGFPTYIYTKLTDLHTHASNTSCLDMYINLEHRDVRDMQRRL